MVSDAVSSSAAADVFVVGTSLGSASGTHSDGDVACVGARVRDVNKLTHCACTRDCVNARDNNIQYFVRVCNTNFNKKNGFAVNVENEQ
jgi:hypothetical protein